MALIKTRMQYLEIVNMEKNKPKEISINDKVVKSKVDDNIEKIDEDSDILDDLDKLIAQTQEDAVKENEPLLSQVSVPQVKTYDDVINDYEANEEEEAVISREELEKKTKIE